MELQGIRKKFVWAVKKEMLFRPRKKRTNTNAEQDKIEIVSVAVTPAPILDKVYILSSKE